MQEENAFVVLLDGDVHGEDAGHLSLELGELVVMRGEKGAQGSPEALGQILGHGPGQGETVVGARSPADLVEDNQAAAARLAQDARGFHHLHHKGALASGEVVRSAHAGKETVHEADFGGGGGDEGAHLGHDADDGDLPQDGGFAGHVGTGEQAEPAVFVQDETVRHEVSLADDFLDNGMASLLHGKIGAVRDDGSGPAVLPGFFGEGLPVVESGNPA